MKEKRKVKFRSSSDGALVYNVPQALYIEPGTKVFIAFPAGLLKKEYGLKGIVEKCYMYKSSIMIKLKGNNKTYLRNRFKVVKSAEEKEDIVEAKVEEEK